ncbi:hypothetical protein RVBP17_1660 [Pseudomonas phage sp. 30-3]|nr:hypothetical protein GBBBJNDB_00097 [Pseudomonas phage Callisto]WPK39763.1 ribosomal protein S21 [Pseudomonas phage Ettore]WPK40284.1 ribosomal protein S21 [Pseudomonas phage Paride]VOH54072.1 30S ribosomal protein S21 [Pseudomonas phage vB_PaeM_MIJ3]BDR25791.1 hypothetical protein RVBP16_2310 [Pseudomonas phage sp. 30-2]BDR26123.1 hypothetical protein RVBP17_1660 [Pseudomonas phage sp. 30-3]
MKTFNIITGLTVEVRHDNFNQALRTFTKKVQNSGKLKEVREREFYEKPSVKKTKAKKAAIQRQKKKKI